MRICQNPGCHNDLDELGLRADAVTCSAACRAARSRTVRAGAIPIVVGPELAFTVPLDWPERSAKFWAGIDAITRRHSQRRSQPAPPAR